MIIQLKDVGKTYPKANFRLEGIHCAVARGDWIGLIGQNGSGKSTILKMMNGLVLPDQGQVLYQDQDTTDLSAHQQRQMRKAVAYIFQQANLLEGETVLYHLKLVFALAKVPIDWTKIDETLALMKLTQLKHVACRDLSGGQQQKVAIAMAILQDPQVLLCDEITSALDANSEQEIIELLSQLRATRQLAIVMISHNLSLLKNFCDQVWVLDKGSLVETITPQAAKSKDPNQDYLNYIKEFLTHAN